MTLWRAKALARTVEISARAWLKLLGRLIAGGKVDQVVRRLAAAHALDVLDNLGDRGARLGERGGMRGDGDAGVLPQRIVRRERLAFEHIEVRVRQVARVELVDQIGYHQVGAAREVDDAAVLLQEREVAAVQDAARLGRERQQADQRVGSAQHRRELGEGGHPGQSLRPAAEAGDVEAEREQPARRIRAELAQAEDADGAIGGEVLLAPAPLSLSLLPP